MLQVPISSGREGGEEEGTAEVEVEVEVEVGKVLAAHCAMCHCGWTSLCPSF
jgi:hypothetical protein